MYIVLFALITKQTGPNKQIKYLMLTTDYIA
jgi:hypothetical protein